MEPYERSKMIKALQERLMELEEEHRMCGGDPVIVEEPLGGTYVEEADYGVTAVRGTAGEVMHSVHKCDLSTQNVELKAQTLQLLAAAKRRVNRVLPVMAENERLDTETIATTTTFVQAYQDKYEWLKGSHHTLDSVLKDAECALTDQDVKTQLEALPEALDPDELGVVLDSLLELPLRELYGLKRACVDEPGDDPHYEETYYQPLACGTGGGGRDDDGVGSNDALVQKPPPTARIVAKALHRNVTRWVADCPDALASFSDLLSFKHDNPRIDLEAALQDGLAKLVQGERQCVELGERQEKLLAMLRSPDALGGEEAVAAAARGIALKLIDVAEQRAETMEVNMQAIRRRWHMIDEHEERLWAAEWPHVAPVAERLQAAAARHDACADVAAEDVRVLERAAQRYEEETAVKADDLERRLAESMRILGEGTQRCAAKWQEMQETGRDLLALFDERIVRVSRHCELVEEAQRLEYAAKVRGSLEARHAARLDAVAERHRAVAEAVRTVADALSQSHEDTLAFQEGYRESVDDLYEPGARMYERLMDHYCRLIGDLLQRRRNRVGMIDLEGTVLKLHVDAGCSRLISDQGDEEKDNLERDVERLHDMKTERAEIVAYLDAWSGRLEKERDQSTMIYEVAPPPPYDRLHFFTVSHHTPP